MVSQLLFKESPEPAQGCCSCPAQSGEDQRLVEKMKKMVLQAHPSSSLWPSGPFSNNSTCSWTSSGPEAGGTPLIYLFAYLQGKGVIF